MMRHIQKHILQSVSSIQDIGQMPVDDMCACIEKSADAALANGIVNNTHMNTSKNLFRLHLTPFILFISTFQTPIIN